MYKLPKLYLTVVTFIFLAMPAAAQDQGRLALFLFNGETETPLKDVAVTFPDGGQAQTDDKGKVVWRVDAGTYTVQLHLQTPTIPLEVTIQSASITEIIYTHFPSGAEAERGGASVTEAAGSGARLKLAACKSESCAEAASALRSSTAGSSPFALSCHLRKPAPPLPHRAPAK